MVHSPFWCELASDKSRAMLLVAYEYGVERGDSAGLARMNWTGSCRFTHQPGSLRPDRQQRYAYRCEEGTNERCDF